MSAATATVWPEVPTDEHGYMRCPLPQCGEELRLIWTCEVLLVAQQDTDHAPTDSIADYWAVECINGHKLMDNCDLARVVNAEITDPDSEDFLDESGESAAPFDLMRLHQWIAELAS